MRCAALYGSLSTFQACIHNAKEKVIIDALILAIEAKNYKIQQYIAKFVDTVNVQSQSNIFCVFLFS